MSDIDEAAPVSRSVWDDNMADIKARHAELVRQWDSNDTSDTELEAAIVLHDMPRLIVTVEQAGQDLATTRAALEQAERERDAAHERSEYLHDLLVNAWNDGEHAGWCPHDTSEAVCICWRAEVDTYLQSLAVPTNLEQTRAALAAAERERDNARRWSARWKQAVRHWREKDWRAVALRAIAERDAVRAASRYLLDTLNDNDAEGWMVDIAMKQLEDTLLSPPATQETETNER